MTCSTIAVYPFKVLKKIVYHLRRIFSIKKKIESLYKIFSSVLKKIWVLSQWIFAHPFLNALIRRKYTIWSGEGIYIISSFKV